MKIIIDTIYPNNQSTRIAEIKSLEGNERDYSFSFWLNSKYYKFHSITEFENALQAADNWKDLVRKLNSITKDDTN